MMTVMITVTRLASPVVFDDSIVMAQWRSQCIGCPPDLVRPWVSDVVPCSALGELL